MIDENIYNGVCDAVVGCYSPYNLAALCLHGSHLYGIATDESDIDIKGVYLPSFNEVLCGRAKVLTDEFLFQNRKIDISIYPVGKFVNMLCSNENIAMEMLYADTHEHGLLYTTDLWWDVIEQRHKFLRKDLKGMMSFCKKYYKILLNGGDSKRKDVSHLLRVLFQIEQLYLDGCMSFPSVWGKEISSIKHDVDKPLSESLEHCAIMLKEVERLMGECVYTEEVDTHYINELMLHAYTSGQGSRL